MHLPDFIIAGQGLFASIAVGVGWAMLAIPSPNYQPVRVLFWLASLSFGTIGIVWAMTSEGYSVSTQMTVAAICAAVAAAGLVWGLRQIPTSAGSTAPAASLASPTLPTIEGNTGIITKDQKGDNAIIKR